MIETKDTFCRNLRPAPLIWVNVEYRISVKRLSFTGVVRTENGATASQGQIVDKIDPTEATKEFGVLTCMRLKYLWKRWHLNDMRAGTPRQEQMVTDWMESGNQYDYTAVCKLLQAHGILVDGDYKYGTKWLHEDVPEEVLEILFSMPGTGATYEDLCEAREICDNVDITLFEAILFPAV